MVAVLLFMLLVLPVASAHEELFEDFSVATNEYNSMVDDLPPF